MDIIDILNPCAEYTAIGTYYTTRPLNHNAGGAPLRYAYVEPRSKAFSRLFANVIVEDGGIAIRTNQRVKIVPGESCIRTQDGQLYLVSQVMEDFSTAPKQSLRIFKRPPNVELLIRMTPINDPLTDTI